MFLPPQMLIVSGRSHKVCSGIIFERLRHIFDEAGWKLLFKLSCLWGKAPQKKSEWRLKLNLTCVTDGNKSDTNCGEIQFIWICLWTNVSNCNNAEKNPKTLTQSIKYFKTKAIISWYMHTCLKKNMSVTGNF